MFKKIIISIKANILVGFFLTVPIVATILIFNFVFNLTTNWLPEGFFPKFKNVLHGYPLRITTLFMLIIALYIVGLLVRNIMGRRLYQIGDKILTKIPFIKGIYISVRQISESLFTQRNSLFKEVVLIEYPRKGLFSLAFVTAKAPDKIEQTIHNASKTKDECVSLFISTTPNPTSGVFILVPRSEVIPLHIPISDALTFIMSAGAVSPGDDTTAAPTLLDKLEKWLKHGDKEDSQEDPNAGEKTT